MQTASETTEIAASGGAMEAVVFRPIGDARHPAVIMVHGAPGLDDGTLGMAERLAGEGFVVLAPDMFYRTGRRQVMQPDWSIERRNAMQAGKSNATDIADVQVMVDWLRRQPYVGAGGVGITGFCMGGRISWLAAARVNGIGAAVMYYPTALVTPDRADPSSEAPIELADEIKAPLLGFFPTLDLKHCSPETIARVHKALERAKAPSETIPVEGARHGFLDPTSKVHHPVEGPKAWTRMVAFFHEHLDDQA
jgi:carboxymethylenebutenolidase